MGKYYEQKKNLCTIIGLIYGPQENDKNSLQFFEQIENKIASLNGKGDIILVGDFNAKISTINNEFMSQKISKNGIILNNILQRQNLENLDKCSQKPTFISHDGKHKSIIDFVFQHSENKAKICEFRIDHDDVFRIQSSCKNKVSTTDHRTFFFSIPLDKRRDRKTKKKVAKSVKVPNVEVINDIIKTFNYDHSSDSIKNYHNFHKKLLEGENLLHKEVFVKIENRKSINEINFEREKKILKNSIRTSHGQDRYDLIGKLKKIISHIHAENESKRNSALRKVLEKIIKGDVNSKNFWDQLKRVGRKETIETVHTINDEGIIIDNPESAKEFIAKYYEDLYQIRIPEVQFTDFDKMVKKKINDLSPALEKCETITIRELNDVIKTLKIGKSIGPDNVSNRLIKILNNENREKLANLLSMLYSENLVPTQWKSGMVTSIYKGKGQRGHPKNDRGITISSNILKIMEKIVKNKISDKIFISEYQGGGRKNIGTRDHIVVLSSLIEKHKKNKVPLHMVFLDVEKAFDKAWFDGILHLLMERGLDQKNTSYLKELNRGYHVSIKTPHGVTKPVSCEDVLKQGSVLSPIQFGISTDEIANQLEKADLGAVLGGRKIPCTLWVDDIQCANLNYCDAQKSVDIISDTADKYKTKFGMNKTNHVIIGKDPKPKTNLILKKQVIEKKDQYKHLGIIHSSDGLMTKHIKMIDNKVKVITSKIMQLASDDTLKNVENLATIKLIENTINSIIIYGTEALVLKKKDIDKLDSIQYNSIRNLFALPWGTPKGILRYELRIVPMELQIMEKQVTYLHQTLGGDDNLSRRALESIPYWRKLYNRITTELNLDIHDQPLSKLHLKNIVKEAIAVKHEKDTRERSNQSKTRWYINHCDLSRSNNNDYLKCVSKFNARAILMYKTKMMAIKSNTKWRNKDGDLYCRWCSTADEAEKHTENEKHIMEECEPVMLKHGNGIRNIIPDLNEASPFLQHTEEKWNAIGTFLANINRDLMENGSPNTQTKPVSSEDPIDDVIGPAVTTDDGAHIGGTVQPII